MATATPYLQKGAYRTDFTEGVSYIITEFMQPANKRLDEAMAAIPSVGEKLKSDDTMAVERRAITEVLSCDKMLAMVHYKRDEKLNPDMFGTWKISFSINTSPVTEAYDISKDFAPILIKFRTADMPVGQKSQVKTFAGTPTRAFNSFTATKVFDQDLTVKQLFQFCNKYSGCVSEGHWVMNSEPREYLCVGISTRVVEFGDKYRWQVTMSFKFKEELWDDIISYTTNEGHIPAGVQDLKQVIKEFKAQSPIKTLQGNGVSIVHQYKAIKFPFTESKDLDPWGK